jgi:hypothetical protein
MKNFLLLFFVLVSTSAFAAEGFICKTKTDDGYYVKTTMKLKVNNSKSVFAVPYDSISEVWNNGSTGSLSSVRKDGTSVFIGFSSEDMFGDLSEGLADKGIYLYVSAQVMSGKSGWVNLVARGTEVGLEKAGYFCKLDQ